MTAEINELIWNSCRFNEVFLWFVSSLLEDRITLMFYRSIGPPSHLFLQSQAWHFFAAYFLSFTDLCSFVPTTTWTSCLRTNSTVLIRFPLYIVNFDLAARRSGPRRPLFTQRKARFNASSYFRPPTRCRWLFFGSGLRAWRCFCCFSPREGWSSSTGCPGSRWRWTHTCWSGWKGWCCAARRSPWSPLGAPGFRKIF